MSEQEKRLHRCCFTGHRPEKLYLTEIKIVKMLEEQIKKAIEEGKPYCGDISDDSYIVIDGPGYQWHMHVDALGLFKPHFPIPKNIMRKYEKIWEGYLEDRRKCYGDNPTEGQI